MITLLISKRQRCDPKPKQMQGDRVDQALAVITREREKLPAKPQASLTQKAKGASFQPWGHL